MAWEIEYTDQFEAWFGMLNEDEQESVVIAVEILQDQGPGLGRPLVDTIKGSRHANMKELRPRRGNLRVLFAFDPRRMAILLIGGDKTHRWEAWYQNVIPLADRLYEEHLETLEEGRITAMTKTKPFAELADQIKADPVRRERIAIGKRALEDALALAKLRDRQDITQKELAETLGVTQANISRIEHEEDLYLSTLRGYVAALGGELEIHAVFPDGKVALVPAER